jgi:pilus assembly protein CpaC
MSASPCRRTLTLALTLASSLVIPAFVYAQSLMGAPVGADALGSSMAGQRVAVGLSDQDTQVRTLSLPRGKSATIDLPRDARDVIVSDPKVADVVLSTPRRIFVLGVGSGQTDAAFMDAGGRQILRINIRVDQDISALSETLNRILPRASIRVDSVNDSLILSGEVPDAASADKAVRVAGAFVTKPEQVINMLGVAQSEQVALKVKVIEVNRTVIKQLGFNLSEVMGQLGSPQYLLGTTATWGVNGSLLGGISGGYKFDTTQQPEVKVYDPLTNSYDLNAVARNNPIATNQASAGSKGVNSASALLNAFERTGLVRTLAEQTLTSVSGESAKFLAGGEFPVPVAVDNTGRITAEFKPYGVGLGFTPVVLSSGLISVKMSTEVSELTSVGAIQLSGGGTSLSLPGLNVRRGESTVELPSGGAIMLAGLIQSQTKQTLDGLPGLTQLPVIGALLRSRDFQNNETELVIIVEAYLVKPGRPDQMQTPADGLQIASDVETNLLGHLNTGFGKTPPANHPASYQGPYGYVVD